MKTVKISKLKTGYACEFHDTECSLISIQEYSSFATGDMAKDAAEWCARTQFASTKEEPEEPEGYSFEEQMAHYPDPPPRVDPPPEPIREAPKHQQRHQEAQERGDFNPWQSTLQERKEEFYKKPKWLPGPEEVDKAQEHWTE